MICKVKVIYFILEPVENGLSPPKFTPPVDNTDKPDSQLQDRIKEDEVSSSEEAFKTESSTDDVNKDGNSYLSVSKIFCLIR